MARLLTFNSHEGYVWLLAQLGFELDVIVDLPGRTMLWDDRMRPLPTGARLIRTREATGPYVAAIAHNITDLVALRPLGIPAILVLHGSLDARLAEERGSVNPADFRRRIAEYVRLTHTHVVAVSDMKAASWDLECDVIPPGLDPGWFGNWTGTVPMGLRVANQVSRKQQLLDWELHAAATRDIPWRLVGRDEQLPNVAPASDWADLLALMNACRFFIFTSDGRYEDAWNLASIEAMLSGMPIVCSGGAECPVEDGVSGIVSRDPAQLNAGMRLLLEDHTFARRMGGEARKAAMRRFPQARFMLRWHRAIESAIRRQRDGRAKVPA